MSPISPSSPPPPKQEKPLHQITKAQQERIAKNAIKQKDHFEWSVIRDITKK